MRVTVFSAHEYDRQFMEPANTDYGHDLVFLDTTLNMKTVNLAQGAKAVCVFVNDTLDKNVLRKLKEYDVEIIALRCSGHNNVDLEIASELGFRVVFVPAYSPEAVAEYAVTMMLTLNRRTHHAYRRTRDGNFSLNGMLGFDMKGKTVGIIGTGKVGGCVAKILHGFGCKIIAHDSWINPACQRLGIQYVPLDTLLKQSDIISLHCQLTVDTEHLINAENIAKMKEGVMLINTSRGAVLDTPSVINALKSGKIGYLGMDVYELEEELFFEDNSNMIIQDDDFERLLSFHNVLISGHQGFFTREAMEAIAFTTLDNLHQVGHGAECENVL